MNWGIVKQIMAHKVTFEKSFKIVISVMGKYNIIFNEKRCRIVLLYDLFGLKIKKKQPKVEAHINKTDNIKTLLVFISE